MATIIVSAPHAVCRNDIDKQFHFCDIPTKALSKKIADRLSKEGHDVRLVQSDKSRIETDMNRKEGRGSDFRNKVESHFKDADFLLDVHSFPDKNTHWGEDAILLKSNGGQNNKYVCELMNHLVRADMNVGVAYGKKPNDVVGHAMENDVPAVLVEFSEVALKEDEERVFDRFMEGLLNHLSAFGITVGESDINKYLSDLRNFI